MYYFCYGEQRIQIAQVLEQWQSSLISTSFTKRIKLNLVRYLSKLKIVEIRENTEFAYVQNHPCECLPEHGIEVKIGNSIFYHFCQKKKEKGNSILVLIWLYTCVIY